MSETWFGTAEIIGDSAIVAATYPFSGGRHNDATGDLVEFALQEPFEVPGPLGKKLLCQRIELRVTAADERVEGFALETLSEIADSLSFATGGHSQVSLGSLTTAPPGSQAGPYRSMLLMQPVRTPGQLVGVPADYLAQLWKSIDDTESERGRRIVRTLRWYRRATGALDESEEFSFLAVAFEALTGLIAALPAPSPGRAANRRRQTKRPESSEVLRAFALHVAGVTEEQWKRVGRLRNNLFHGGLSEDASTRGQLSAAIPHLRLVVTVALRKLLAIPDHVPPAPRLLPAFSRPTLIFDGAVVRTKLPSDNDVSPQKPP